MIPVEEIPHLMCALGYFPTQLEITNMTNEVKYSKFAETSTLDLDEKNLRNRKSAANLPPKSSEEINLFLCLVGFLELYILSFGGGFYYTFFFTPTEMMKKNDEHFFSTGNHQLEKP